nr:DUF2235 domain-containing protein [Sphingomicrobium sediminis]
MLALSACQVTRVGTVHLDSRYAFEDRDRPPSDILIVIDGTANNSVSRTNAVRMYEIAETLGSVSDRPLVTYYAEGVGAGKGEFRGALLGKGTGEDVREAYRFLTRVYRPGDRIILAGFSRGAYAQRLLTGMIAVAGIPDMSGEHWDRSARRSKVHDIWDAYRSPNDAGLDALADYDRREKKLIRDGVLADIAERNGAAGMKDHDWSARRDASRNVDTLALFDVVAELGGRDGNPDPFFSDPYYWVQPCGAGHLFHAMALDDNRSKAFTLVMAEQPQMPATCPKGLDRTEIEEVWFSGAHADVGGNYVDGDDLIVGLIPGVSLNWMLDRLAAERDLFALAPRVKEDRYGPLHDAQKYTWAYFDVDRVYRDPIDYARRLGGKPKIHYSVVQRLERASDMQARYDDHCGEDAIKTPRLLCHELLRNRGFRQELRREGCVEGIDREAELTGDVRDWHLKADQTCIEVVGW